MQDSSKERLQFDFTADALARLDRMKEQTQASTRAEVVREALRLYEWFVDDVEPDHTIKVFDKDDKLVAAFKASMLRR